VAHLTYTEDRETFERQMFRTPPHAARLAEHAGRYIGRLTNGDKEMLLADAILQFWEMRDQIKETQDILKLWVKALEYAAKRRPKWHLWSSGYDWWVKGSQLGRQS
jgi:hypothetical protein